MDAVISRESDRDLLSSSERLSVVLMDTDGDVVVVVVTLVESLTLLESVMDSLNVRETLSSSERDAVLLRVTLSSLEGDSEADNVIV